MPEHRIYKTAFSKVYPLYVTKAERKGRTKKEVDQIICWLTGYSPAELRAHLKNETDFETFFMQASTFNANSALIKGVVCGVRVEDVKDPRMRRLR